MNRLATSPSPRYDDRGTERTHSSKDQQRNTHATSRFRNVDNRFSTAHMSVSLPEGGEDDGAEILLSGSDYWRLDASIANERQPVFNSTKPLVAQQHHRPSNLFVDPMGETMNETGEWNSMRREGNELDEFAMLEKQLEDLSAPHNGPRQHSQSHSSNSALLTPAFPSQTSYGTQRASRPNLSRANSLGNSIRLSEEKNRSNQPESSDSKGHHHDYHDHDSRHSRQGGASNNTDDDDDEEEREQSFLGSTSSTNYPNSSRRLDNPFLTSYGGIDKRRQMADDAPTSERTQRVDSSQSWGAVTRPKLDADVSSDVNEEYDDDIGFNGTMSAPSRNSRSSMSSAFPIGERKSDTAWDRDQSSNREDNIHHMKRSEVQITHSRPVLPPRDGGRDTVRSNLSHTGRNKNSNVRGSSRSGSRDRKDEGRSASGAGAGSGLASTSTNSREDPEEVRRYLNGKAKELEAELATYRQENMTLRKMKKEQEVALSEKKAEVHKWAVEERQKTEVWCEEQRQAASRERNAALKLARDSRLAGMGGAGTLGARKERAEIEALQATLEKVRIDYDSKEKKWKANERRLQQLVKDNSASTEELQQQISNLEQNKQAIWAYLDSIGVRLPGSLIRAIGNTKKEVGGTIGGNGIKTSSIGFGSTVTGNKDTSSNSQKGGPRNLYNKTGSLGRTIVGTYAVEVDPERLEMSSTNRQTVVLREGGMGSEMHRGGLANAIFNNDARGNAAPYYDDNGGDDLDQNNEKNSVPLKPSNFHHEPRPISSASSRGQTALSSTTRLSQPDRGRSGGMNALGIDSDLKASWARSSRSSRASRYSSDDNSPLSDDEVDLGRTSTGRNEFADTIKATHSGTNRHTDKERERENDRHVDSGRDEDRTRSSTVRVSVSDTHPPTAEVNTTASAYDSNASPDGNNSKRTEEVLPDGRRLISYRNGTRKEMLPTGETLVRFVNGDSKTTGSGSSGVVVYYYAQADTTHTTYKDGLEVYEFPNKQVLRALHLLCFVLFNSKESVFNHSQTFLYPSSRPPFKFFIVG